MKIVINTSDAPFRLSELAVQELRQFDHDLCIPLIERNNEHLVNVVERLGFRSGAFGVNLMIIEINDESLNSLSWEVKELKEGGEAVCFTSQRSSYGDTETKN